jgi:LuxR family maltose regulon positive regulatory protein
MTSSVLSEAGAPREESSRVTPPVRPGVVPRPRLAALQAAVLRSRLVLVSAPAGYGKSTLVAQWVDRDPRASRWVQLGNGDNDPVVLLGRIAAALKCTGPVDGELLAELSRPAPRIDEVALPLLAADLAARNPFILVLDDVDAITAEKSRAILALLVAQVRPGCQLVLVTRGDPGVPLGRLRAGGEVVEIGADDLALDAQETRDVAASGGVQLSADAAEALRARTEGWAAAVVLATLSLRGRDDADARAAALSGDQAQIADYLLEEVLQREPEHFERFLLGTSILERMTAPLCDAVLGTADAAVSLESLARANAFVVALDDRREWYRYHRLFRDLLRGELSRRHPELLSTYRRRAADWCEQHGTPDEAFLYAHEGGDLAQAGRIALAHRDEFAMRGQSETVRLWLESCTDEEIRSDPQLAIAAAWVYFYGGDPVRAKRFSAAAARGMLDVASADGASSLRSSLASVRTLLAPDGISQMLRDGEVVYALEKRAGTRWLASGCRAKGVAHVLLGRPQEAIAELREGLAILSDQPELAHVRVGSLAYLAFAAAELGNRRDVQRWAVEATLLVADARLEEAAGSVAAYTAGALAHQQRGDHTEAARQLEHVRRLRRHLRAARWADVDLALRCADISLELGDSAGALEFSQVAGDGLQGYPDPGTLPARLHRLEERIKSGQDYGLTAAELRVLSFLSTHLSLQEIADRLYLARPTVKTHVASIYEKLGVPGRSEAVEMIDQLGLGSTAARLVPPDPDLN